MAEYSFDTDEKQFFLLSDELKGLMVAMDDGKANFLYVKGEGYVEDSSLLDYVWPNSPKFGQAKAITEEEAKAFTEELEKGKMPYEAYKEIFGDVKPHASVKGMTWEKMEGDESHIADGMNMDEMYDAWKKMLDEQ